jgi:ADP-ribosyl-[dinitrogen reductase] hydrolase
MSKTLNHYQGALIGAAIGDALGFLTEKKSIVEIRLFIEVFIKTGTYSIPNRTFPKKYLFGQYSDDTQFSKILLESLIENNSFLPDRYFDNLLQAFKKNELIGLGGSTRLIFKAAKDGRDLSELIQNSSNGSLMRSFVVGLYFSCPAQIVNCSKIQSALTHNTKEAILCCQIMALSMNFLKLDLKENLLLFWEQNNLLKYDFSFLNLSIEAAQKYIHNLSPSSEWEFVTPSAKATLAAVMYCVYNSSGFEESILKAISLGGDTDSVASLTGALMGFELGLTDIPSKWQNIIHDQKQFDQSYFLKLAEKLFISTQ